MAAIALGAAFAGRRPGVVAGRFLVAALVIVSDVEWIRAEMARPDWDAGSGPDMDVVFHFGVVFRVILVNAVLLPFTFLGLALARRLRRAAPDKSP
jgi:hypothetical protein